MAIFLGIVGMFGFVGCLIWLIVSAIRWDSKKPPLMGMLACVVLFVAGMVMYSPEEPSQTPDTAAPTEAATEPVNRSMEQSAEPSEEDQGPPAAPEESGPLKTGDYELPNGVKLHFYDSVRNDVTGRWRRSGTSSSMPPSEFAVAYYETMFSSDDEIHSVWNATLDTTTKISVSGNLLFVDTYEYVDKEEQDAKIMFSGKLLDSQIIDLATGQPYEEPEPEPGQEPEPEPTPQPVPTEAPAENTPKPESVPSTGKITTPALAPSSSSGSGGGGNADNFNTYDNAEQQQTTANWVLNTSTMKIHYPNCNEVRKIAPQNYATSNLSEQELIGQGYTTCGRCH